MLLMMRMLLEQVGLIRFFLVLTYGKGGKGGEEKVEEHKVDTFGRSSLGRRSHSTAGTWKEMR